VAWGYVKQRKTTVVATGRAEVRTVAPKVAPRTPKGAKMEAKRSLLGLLGVPVGGKIRDSGPLRKHHYLLWFSYILVIRARPFSHPGTLHTRIGREAGQFSRFLGHSGRESAAKGGPGCPKGLQNDTQGHPKSI